MVRPWSYWPHRFLRRLVKTRFLRRGKMTALLKAWRNKPELRIQLISYFHNLVREVVIENCSGKGIVVHFTTPQSTQLYK